MDRATLRQHLLASIDRVLSNRLLAHWLSDLDRQLLAAQRALYAADDDVVDKLLARLPGR